MYSAELNLEPTANFFLMEFGASREEIRDLLLSNFSVFRRVVS